MPEQPSPQTAPGGRTAPPAAAEAVAALARQVDRLQRALDTADVPGVRDELRALAVTVAGLAEEVADLAATGPGRERPTPSWLWPVDPGDPGLAAGVAGQLLEELIGWAGRVYVQYDGGRLPECWLWHPAVVEELVWLWQAWRAAYRGPGASVHRAADWHDRQRPGVTRRIAAAAGSCSLREHLDSGPGPVVPTAGAAVAVAGWRADPAGPAPVPTAEQIRAADAAVGNSSSGYSASASGGWR